MNNPEEYKSALDWLFSQLPMFSRVGAAAYKPGLDTSHAIDTYFNHPHRKFKSIHVGGTNGKGSTSHMLASILQSQGYKTGLYTSPHLVDFRERMRINGEMIPRENVIEFVKQWKECNYDGHPSFFELTMMMAFDWFAKENVDYAIIEVGMGGRLDSTNIITPEVCIITNISNDHTQFLGDTLPKIAAEKAGIIKQGIPVVIGEAEGEIREIFEQRAKEVGAPIIFAEDHPQLLSITEITPTQSLHDASCLNTMPHDATCLNTTPHDASCFDTMPHDASCLNTMPHDASCLNTTPHDASCFGTMPHDASCLNTTPHDASCLNTTPHDASCLNTMPHDASCFNTMPHDASCLNTMPHDASCLNTTPHDASCFDTMPHDASCFNTMPHDASCFNTMPHDASCFNTMPHDASCFNTMPHDASCLNTMPHTDSCCQQAKSGWLCSTSEGEMTIPLPGDYQRKNINTVLNAVKAMRESGIAISSESVVRGMEGVHELTGLQGRWTILSNSPLTIADTGHNIAGITYNMAQLRRLHSQRRQARLHIVIGFVADKAIDKILKLLPEDAVYYLTNAQIPRALPAAELRKRFNEAGLDGEVFPDVKTAFTAAQKAAKADDIIFIGGSTFIVADLLS